MRTHLHPRDMNPEERFELVTDIFAEAFVEIRLAESIAQMQAETAVYEVNKSAEHSQTCLEVFANHSPDGARIQ